MDYTQVMNKVDSVLKDNLKQREKLCLLINGEWGIGKTYTISKWFKEHEAEYVFKYISVFGKNDLRQIENEIILSIFPINNFNIKPKSENIKKIFSITKLATNAVKEVAENKLGIKLEMGEYVKNINIEDLIDNEKEKKLIICIDDIERSSPDINIKDILGLIERTTRKFNVLLLSNLDQIQDKECFNQYKEKVIDYEFSINCLNDELLLKILRDYITGFESEKEFEIINTYKDRYLINVGGKEKDIRRNLNNLRIFKKYVFLISRVNEKVNERLIANNSKSRPINTEFIEASMNCISHYYFNPTGKVNLEDFKLLGQKKIVNDIIWKIFRYEDFEDKDLDSVLDWELEVSVDIRSLYGLYILGNNEINCLLKKIVEKINLKDEKYFVKQQKIISIFDALNEIEYPKIDRIQLLEIAKELYKPSLESGVANYPYEEWDDMDYTGKIPCKKETRDFIDLVNDNNQIKFEAFKNECVKKAVESNDLSTVLCFPERIIFDSVNTFDGFFSRAFNNLIKDGSKGNWEIVFKVVRMADNELVYDYLSIKINNEVDMIRKNKLKHIIDVLEEEAYYEHQALNNQDLNNYLN